MILKVRSFRGVVVGHVFMLFGETWAGNLLRQFDAALLSEAHVN